MDVQGYYHHSEPYTPEWPGMIRGYKGHIVHPQLWDPTIDVQGKRVV